MSFTNDVFISYAHLDNQALTDEDKGWVTAFHSDLRALLSQRLGRDLKIWRDDKLTGNDEFTNEIVDQLPQSAVLISVVSPRYVDSEWCLRELDTFVSRVTQREGLHVGNRARICKVIKTYVPQQRLPEVLARYLGFEFYDYDPETRRGLEYDRRFGQEAREAYYRRLNDLVWAVGQVLEGLGDQPSRGSARSLTAVRPGGAGRSVYLAETTYDLRDVRAALRRDLEEQGHSVLPDCALPYSPEFEVVVREQLARASLSVHLIGARYGTILEGQERSIVEQQLDLAGELAREAGLERLLWVRPGTESGDEAHGALLARLRDGSEGGAVDLLETPVEELKAIMYEALAPKASGGATSVYVAETTLDQRAVRAALVAALETEGYSVYPEEALPYTPDYAEAVRAELAQADVAIHLLGARYGTIPEGAERSVVELQLELSAELAQAGRIGRRLVWWPQGLSVLEPRQEEHLNLIRLRSETDAQSELLETAPGALPEAVLSRLRAPEPEPAEAPTGGGAILNVYLLYDMGRDAETVGELVDHLFEQQLEVIEPGDGSPQEVRAHHEASLKTAAAVVLFYGNCGSSWMRAQLDGLQGAVRPAGSLTCVYVGPPESPRKRRFQSHHAEVIQAASGFEPADLAPLVARLKSGSG